MKNMHNPPHPAEIIREDVLPALQMSVTDLAKRLNMTREMISRVVNGKAGISPDLALRLEMAGISSARAWLGAQAEYDLWQAQQKPIPEITLIFGGAHAQVPA